MSLSRVLYLCIKFINGGFMDDLLVLVYPIVIVHDEGDTKWSVSIPDIYGAITASENKTEAIKKAKELIKKYFKSRPDLVSLPSTLEDTKHKYKFDHVELVEVEVSKEDYSRVVNPYNAINVAIARKDVDQIKKQYQETFLKGRRFSYFELGKCLQDIYKEVNNPTLVEELFKMTFDAFNFIYPDELKFIPIHILMDMGKYEQALEYFALGEDENCTLNTDAYYFLMEGICLYKLKRYKEAERKFSLACSDEDYSYEAHQYLDKIEKKTK